MDKRENDLVSEFFFNGLFIYGRVKEMFQKLFEEEENFLTCILLYKAGCICDKIAN